MTVKEITKMVAESLPVDTVITTEQLRRKVLFSALRKGRIINPHRDTILRYIRHMHDGGERVYACVDNHKSVYRRVR